MDEVTSSVEKTSLNCKSISRSSASYQTVCDIITNLMRILSYYQTTGTMLALVIMVIGTMADMLRVITKCF